jgi:ABC-type antimicrobial peptide transport system permease subunit
MKVSFLRQLHEFWSVLLRYVLCFTLLLVNFSSYVTVYGENPANVARQNSEKKWKSNKQNVCFFFSKDAL